MRKIARSLTRPAVRKRRLAGPHIQDGGIDSARAQAAYAVAASYFDAQIAAVMGNHTLTADQRRAMIATLRRQQRQAAEAARRQVLDDERAAAKERAMRRRHQRRYPR